VSTCAISRRYRDSSKYLHEESDGGFEGKNMEAPILLVEGELGFCSHAKSANLQLHELNAEVMQAC